MSHSILMRRTCRCLGVVALVSVLGASLVAAEEPTRGISWRPADDALSMEGAVAFALEHHPALRAGRARVDAAAGWADDHRRWSNPELEVVVEEWGVERSRGFADSKQTLGIIQTLPFPGKKSLDRRIGAAAVERAERELAVLRVERVRDVKAAYVRALATERMVDLAGELVRFAGEFAAAAAQRVEAGAAASQEQLRAEIQWETARAALAEYRRDQDLARQMLGSLMGDVDLAGVALSGRLMESEDSSLWQESGGASLSGHPSTTVAEAMLERAGLEERRAGLDTYPDVTVGVAGGRLGETDESIVELRFAVPLPILNRGRGRRQEASARVVEAEAELVEVRQELRRELARARTRYGAALEQVRVYRERLIPKATEALTLIREGFENGKFSFMDLLDTQRTSAEVQVVYQQKLIELGVAHAELEAVVRPGVEATWTDPKQEIESQ